MPRSVLASGDLSGTPGYSIKSRGSFAIRAAKAAGGRNIPLFCDGGSGCGRENAGRAKTAAALEYIGFGGSKGHFLFPTDGIEKMPHLVNQSRII